MRADVSLLGMGYAAGSNVLRNEDVALSLGLKPDWIVRRTGIVERRVAADDETATSLAGSAVTRALGAAGLDPGELGDETVLLHIQNGFTHLTPPASVLLCGHLGLHRVRALGIDGACAEPISAFEMAVLMLQAGRCERVVLSAASHFLPVVDQRDPGTAGLFGSGAGALVLAGENVGGLAGTVRSIRWATYSRHWELGAIPVLDIRDAGPNLVLEVGRYQMLGAQLARIGLQVVNEIIADTLEEAAWAAGDIDVIIAHQPNVRLLEMLARRMGVSAAVIPTPGSHLGNMGPASLLVNLALAEDKLVDGAKVILTSFGLGFSCGAIALQMQGGTR